MSTPFRDAAGIPVNPRVPVLTYSPVPFAVPGRPVPLEIKVSAPATGLGLPVILLSHGHGSSNYISSLYGYGPLVDFWAAHGFVVIQPTHLDATMLALREAQDPDAPLYSRSRVEDMHYLLDHLDVIEATVPGLAGRIDPTRIAAAGHSLGGHTVGMLLGQTAGNPDGTRLNQADDRIKAGVLFAPPGLGRDVAEFAGTHYPIVGTTEFGGMTTPALIVAGDQDANPMFSARSDWRSDAYRLSPAPKCLLTVFGAGHMLGGISSWDAAETTDENPERVAMIRALAWAYLRSQLFPGDTSWADAQTALEASAEPLGRVESK